jgi:hypothetical protein
MLNRNLIFTSLVVIAVGSSTFAEGEVYTVTGKSGKHRYRLKFETRLFSSRGREIVWLAYTPEWEFKGTRRVVNKDEKLYYYAGLKEGRYYIRFHGMEYESVETMRRKTAEAWLRWRGETELVSLSVTVDGRRRPVSTKIYARLLDPHPEKEYRTVRLSKDGKTLNVQLDGSDAAAAYIAVWAFRRNGRHSFQILPGS